LEEKTLIQTIIYDHKPIEEERLMGVTPQELQDFYLFLKAIGATLLMVAWLAGHIACAIVFIYGALKLAEAFCGRRGV